MNRGGIMRAHDPVIIDGGAGGLVIAGVAAHVPSMIDHIQIHE